jgi:ABC-type nitrate/sulfonate/bicarbonate transport system substrate-binding protein
MRNARLGLGAFAVALIAGLGWWLWPVPPPPEPLVLAVTRSTFGAPLWVAERQGFFSAEGLAVTLRPYATGKLAFEAMLRGEAQVATVTETPLVLASLAGAPFTVIANYASSTEHSLVARADRGIAAVSDLRGRRVGVAPGTSGQYFLHVLLSDEGMSESDIVVVLLPAAEQAAALATGDIDAVAAFAPYSGQCHLVLGDVARSFSTGIRYTGYGSLVVPRDLPRQRPRAMLRLLRALDRTIQWIRTHQDASLALAAAGSGTAAGLLRDGWQTLHPNLSLDQGFVVLLQAEARWAIAAGLVPGVARDAAIPNYLDFIDASALARLHPESVTLIGTSVATP